MERRRRTPRSPRGPSSHTVAATITAVAIATALHAPWAQAQQAGRVDRLVLVDSRTGEPISEIGNGSVISTDRLSAIDVLAETTPEGIGSVVFLVNGERVRVDSRGPFTLSEGEGFANVSLPEGPVTIRAVPFSRSEGRGVQGASLTTSISASPGGTGKGGEDDSEFNIEAEAETETESAINVEAVRGIAGSSQAHGATAAASGNNAVAQSGASGSLSISTDVGGAEAATDRLSSGSNSEAGLTPGGRAEAAPAGVGSSSVDGASPVTPRVADRGAGPASVSLVSAEAEAEAEAEADVEVGVGPGSAVANAGSTAAAAAVGTNTYLRADNRAQTIATATETAIDVGSSTSTATAGIDLGGTGGMGLSGTMPSPTVDGIERDSGSRAGAAGTLRARDASVGTANGGADATRAGDGSRDGGTTSTARAPDRAGTALDPFALRDAAPAAEERLHYVAGPGETVAGEDVTLVFTGIGIDSHKELAVSVDGRDVATLSTFGRMPALGVFGRFRPADGPAPIPARVRIPGVLLDGDDTIAFRHWRPDDSWDVADVRIGTRTAEGTVADASGAVIAPGANGAGSGNVNVLESNNGSGSATPDDDPVEFEIENLGSQTELPDDVIRQIDAEVEVEAESEVEAEVATAPAAAAAGATGVGVVAVVGDFARAGAWNSLATSTSASDVVAMTPPLFLEPPPESAVTEGTVAASRLPVRLRVLERPALVGQGLSEAETEAEGEAETEASVSNNAAAAAAVGGGAFGASGLGATGRVAAATATSTSTEGGRGTLTRRNDEVTGATDRFDGTAELVGAQADAEADAEVSVDDELILEPGFVNVGPQAINNTAFGDAESESFVRLSGFDSVFVDERLVGTRSLPPRRAPERPMPNPDGDLDRGDGVVLEPGNIEIEVETEAEVEAEAEVGFNAAAAAASGIAVQAENGFLSTPAEAAAASSTSTSVFDGEPDDVKMRDLPGRSPDGERGGFITPPADAGNLVFEVETEAEAEAEVGFEAGAAAAAASAAGKRDIQADTQVATSPYAAAAASASGAIVFVDVRLPPEGEAGFVVATARAEDPECNGVSVAVAVAGVPTLSGTDNEAEREAEESCVAIVEVEIFTDPADAATPLLLSGVQGSLIPDRSDSESDDIREPEPFDSTLESESESEAEAEAEAGYGTAAAAASSASAGLFSTADAKTSTSTRAYDGGYDF